MPGIFNNRLTFFILSAVTGLLVGLTTVALIESIGFLQDLLFGQSDDDSPLTSKFSGWGAVLVPVLGGLIISFMLRHISGQRIHGISDVMEASALRAGRMDVRSGLSAAAATWISLGTGSPLGREGPAVHIGASVTAWLAEKLNLDRTQSLTLLGCAAAAAVTASFNTPIAGVIFALEVIVGYYSLSVFAPVVVAAMGAVIVRHSVYGNRPEFSLPDYSIGSLWELAAFAFLGLVAALVVQSFIYLVIAVRSGWDKVGSPRWIRPAFAGLFIGAMALYYPLALGVGYEGTSLALNENLSFALLLGLLLAKLIVGALALGSGTPGGVFSPALFIGAMFGGVYWYFLNQVAPMEVRWQLSARGININTGREQGLIRTATIDKFVTQNFIRVEPDATLSAVEASMYAHRRYIAVVFDEETFVGSLSTDELAAGVVNDREAVCDTAMRSAEHAIPHSTSLLAALQELNEFETNYAPVTRAGEDDVEVVGVIYRSDVLKAMYDMMREARAREHGE